MKKIAFVLPWCGRLPSYFQLWADSCAANPTIDFLLFTSERMPGKLPANVKQISMDFAHLKELFQSHFDFPLALETPYKFCDLKPAYGEVFAAYLQEYDFWGHCDMDLVWGDIRSFVTEDLLEKYDRIYTRGHCCLYRNTLEVNIWYRTLPHEGMQDWKQVFSHEGSFCFDEWHRGGLSEIIRANSKPYYDGRDMADLDTAHGCFWPHGIPAFQHGDTYAAYDHGKLWLRRPKGTRQEVLYCHFQKRPLVIEPHDPQEYYLVAPGYVTSDSKRLRRHRWAEMLFRIRYCKRRVLGKLKKRQG